MDFILRQTALLDLSLYPPLFSIDDRSNIFSMNQAPIVKRRRGRPPKHLSAFSETKAQLIRAGMEILTEKGFSATGIDEILKSIGVPKGSFYHYFESKNDFGMELINSYDLFFKRKLNRFLDDQSLSAQERLAAFIHDAEESMRRHEFTRGCLIGNLGQEMGRLPEEFRCRLVQVFQDWENSVELCLKEAQLEGSISQIHNCATLAYVFWTGWEGAVLRAKLERSPKPLREFSRFYLENL